MTRALFKIERFSFSKSSDRIIVSTNKNCHSIDKAKFERWVDEDEKRQDRTWEQFYVTKDAELALYDYIIIMFTEDVFGDIKTGLDAIAKRYDN